MQRTPSRGLLAGLALGLALVGTAASAFSLDDLRDPEDGRFDASRFLLEHKGVLPVPILITEPALGYGFGVGLLYFRRNEAAADAGGSTRGPVPPDVTALAGFRTENGSDGGALGHLGFSADGRWRYVAALGRVALNLELFADASSAAAQDAAEGLDYELDSRFVLGDLRRRIGDTPWMVGARYLRADATSRFKRTRPPDLSPRQLDTTIAGLALVAEYDDRDNIFTPNRGARLTLSAQDFGQAWGGDSEFRLYRAALNTHWPVQPDLVLSARLDARGASGDTPFYARPYIDLRGIPALRYQGDQVWVAEAEGRWNVDGRWSAVAFAGAGRAAGVSADLGSTPTRTTFGVGLRYFIARLLGLHVGVDVARGPEESAFYVAVGSAWR